MRGTRCLPPPRPAVLLSPVLHVTDYVWVQQQVPVQLQAFPEGLLGPAPVGGNGSFTSPDAGQVRPGGPSPGDRQGCPHLSSPSQPLNTQLGLGWGRGQ